MPPGLRLDQAAAIAKTDDCPAKVRVVANVAAMSFIPKKE